MVVQAKPLNPSESATDLLTPRMQRANIWIWCLGQYVYVDCIAF